MATRRSHPRWTLARRIAGIAIRAVSLALALAVAALWLRSFQTQHWVQWSRSVVRDVGQAHELKREAVEVKRLAFNTRGVVSFGYSRLASVDEHDGTERGTVRTSRFDMGVIADHRPTSATSYYNSWTSWRMRGFGFRRHDGAAPRTPHRSPIQITTLNISAPHWFIILCVGSPWLFAAPGIIRRGRVRRRLRRGRCVKCGYDRAGLAKDAACPECGASCGPEASRRKAESVMIEHSPPSA